MDSHLPHQVLKRDNEGTQIELRTKVKSVRIKLTVNCNKNFGIPKGNFRRDKQIALTLSLQGSGELSKV